MKILKNYSLKNHNTFRVDVKAKYFVEIKSEEELLQSIKLKKYQDLKRFVLGDGANVLFVNDFNGLVIKNLIKGVDKINEDKDSVTIETGAGENWHSLVMYAINHGWGGIENLVYIPGTVGAAPVQNIAAYGQNFSEVFESLDAIEISTGRRFTFQKDDCEFEYRNSKFKGRNLGKYFITKVRIGLSKNPKIDTSYFETGKTYAKNVSLLEELKETENPTIRDVAMAVMRIRKQKLPEVNKIGTAGSVFKNPIVSREKYEELKKKDPNLQSYSVENLEYRRDVEGDFVKIPVGRLLDNLGWKGKRVGNVGTYPTQALAVVNYGAKPQEIVDFMNEMKKAIKKNYDINLEEEILVV